MTGLQGPPLQHKLQRAVRARVRRVGQRTSTGGHTAHKRPGTGDQRARRGPRGLSVKFQRSRQVSHGPAGAYLSRAASPDLQRNARMEPVKDDFGRGNVAFARYGFAERAQNGQRVGVRSPIGAPDDWSSMADPVVPFERNFYGHPVGRTILEKAIRKSSIRTRLGKSSKLGMPI